MRDAGLHPPPQLGSSLPLPLLCPLPSRRPGHRSDVTQAQAAATIRCTPRPPHSTPCSLPRCLGGYAQACGLEPSPPSTHTTERPRDPAASATSRTAPGNHTWSSVPVILPFPELLKTEITVFCFRL